MKQVQTYILFMEESQPKGKILFKIGRSVSVKHRLAQHRCSNPLLTKVFIFDEDIEHYLHCCFDDYRINKQQKSEWFWMHDISIKDTMTLIEDAYHYLVINYPNGSELNTCCIENTAIEYQKYHLNSSDSVLDSCKLEYDYYKSIKVNRKNHKTQVKKIKDNLNNYRVHYQNTNNG